DGRRRLSATSHLHAPKPRLYQNKLVGASKKTVSRREACRFARSIVLMLSRPPVERTFSHSFAR
ncbi:MAG: hypothetical protein JSU86_05720, partial [Phycisphaerales bacterium]